MKYPNKDCIEHLRRKYPPGTRLQLSCMKDEMAVSPVSILKICRIRLHGKRCKAICLQICRKSRRNVCRRTFP